MYEADFIEFRNPLIKTKYNKSLIQYEMYERIVKTTILE